MLKPVFGEMKHKRVRTGDKDEIQKQECVGGEEPYLTYEFRSPSMWKFQFDKTLGEGYGKDEGVDKDGGWLC